MREHLLGRLAASLVLVTFLVPLTASADDDDGKRRSLLDAQLTQFNGGCPPNPDEQPGGCIDVQFSVHRAPVCDNGPNENVGDYSISMVREFAPEGEPSPLAGGSSTLVRAGDGVAFNLSTSDLAPNAPYTVWWVGFNPDNPCIDESTKTCSCTGNDLRPDKDSVFYATGGMSDRLGTATFAGNVEYKTLPDGVDQVPFAPDFANGLQLGAEIHFVIRAHGPALRGRGRRGGDDD